MTIKIKEVLPGRYEIEVSKNEEHFFVLLNVKEMMELAKEMITFEFCKEKEEFGF